MITSCTMTSLSILSDHQRPEPTVLRLSHGAGPLTRNGRLTEFAGFCGRGPGPGASYSDSVQWAPARGRGPFK